MLQTKDYEEYLYGCRFCPMCKPANDVSNATYLECHSTRAHAMIIWRAAHDIQPYTDRNAELLYQANLDGVSEAFCVDHYPVSGFMLAARQDIVAADKAPAPVQAVFDRTQRIETAGAIDGGVAILSSEGIEYGYEQAAARINEIADKHHIGAIHGYQGLTPYLLGNTQKAVSEARAIIQAIEESKIHTVVADGPDTWYCLTKLYGELGLKLPAHIKIDFLSHYLPGKKKGSERKISGKKVFFQDARSSYFLCEELPDEKAILPDFFGPEELLGKGTVYEHPRTVIDGQKAERLFSVWSRGLARSLGNDDGLALTYPKIACRMAKRRLDEIKGLGAECLIVDSLAAVLYLDSLDPGIYEGVDVLWLPELI